MNEEGQIFNVICINGENYIAQPNYQPEMPEKSQMVINNDYGTYYYPNGYMQGGHTQNVNYEYEEQMDKKFKKNTQAFKIEKIKEDKLINKIGKYYFFNHLGEKKEIKKKETQLIDFLFGKFL
jgi:hypothetical protein